MCGNLSGKVDGMIKDCNTAATNIIEALVEKLETTGDVMHLKTQNLKLKDELSEARRKISRQDQEITDLRRSIINLEKEVNALKEGWGPFPQSANKPHKPQEARSNTTSSSREADCTYKYKQQPKRSQQRRENQGKIPTPGCSRDTNYIHRKEGEWPSGPESMDWSVAQTTEQETRVDMVKPRETKIKEKRSQDDDLVVVPSPHTPLRKDIKIIENKLLVPPLLYSAPPIEENLYSSDKDKEWKLVPKGAKKNRVPDIKISQKMSRFNDTPDSGSSAAFSYHNKARVNVIKSNNTKKSKFKPRAIKSAVVTITGKSDGATYAQILSKAKQNVSLASLGIQELRMRRAMNGALIMELPGPEGKRLAGALRNTLEEVLKDDALVKNPVATGEIRLRGIDPATTKEEVSYELEKLSGCPPRDIKVSTINTMKDGMGIAWVYCPLEYAIKMAEKGSITLGWTVVRIELMKKRPIQCFRCWKFGHARINCKSEIDRNGTCLRCGTAGHVASKCSLTPKCLICAEINKEHRHRIGSTICMQNQGFPREVQKIRGTVKSTSGGIVQSHGVQS